MQREEKLLLMPGSPGAGRHHVMPRRDLRLACMRRLQGTMLLQLQLVDRRQGMVPHRLRCMALPHQVLRHQVGAVPLATIRTIDRLRSMLGDRQRATIPCHLLTRHHTIRGGILATATTPGDRDHAAEGVDEEGKPFAWSPTRVVVLAL